MSKDEKNSKVEAVVQDRSAQELAKEQELVKRQEILKYAKGTIFPTVIDELMKQPLVSFMIMRNPLEKGHAVHEYGINEQVFIYPKGVMFTAPESIVKDLANYYHVEMTAGDNYRVDRNPTIQGALS